MHKKTGLKDVDFQRARVYRWEDQIFSNRPLLTDLQREQLVIKICSDLRVPCPILSNGRLIGAWARADQLHFGDGDLGRRDTTVCHEVAHYLQWPDSHGPYWMRVYIELMARYLGLSRHDLLDSSSEWGVATAATLKIQLGVRNEIPRLEDL